MVFRLQHNSIITLLLLAFCTLPAQFGCSKKQTGSSSSSSSSHSPTAGGTATACVTSATCPQGQVCRDTSCKSIFCTAANTSACAADEECDVVSNHCVAQTPCSDSSECGNKVCRGSVCVAPVACSSSLDCERGEVCDATTQKCRVGAACSETEPCQGKGEVCFDGHCSAAGRSCEGNQHAQCGLTEVCQSNVCREGRRCRVTGDCPHGQTCTGGSCQVGSGSSGGGEDRCVAGAVHQLTCAEEIEKCENNVCVPNCAVSELCGGVCCRSGSVCIGESCVADPCNGKANADQRQVCGSADAAVCCDMGYACLNNNCVEMGESCNEETTFCPIISYCDKSKNVGGHCIKYSDNIGNLCLYQDGKKTFDVKAKLYWHGQIGEEPEHHQVMTIPLVGDVSGPNYQKDGIPDLIINSYSVYIYPEAFEPGVLRVMSGKHKSGGPEDIDYWWDSRSIRERAKRRSITGPALNDYEDFWTFGLSTGALGDINNDGIPDIVIEEQVSIPTVTEWSRVSDQYSYLAPTRLRAVNATDGKTIWKSPIGVSHSRGDWNAVALANLDHTGAAEVLFNDWVLDGETGNVLCRLQRKNGSYVTNMTPLAADLDETGNMEIVAGRETFSFTRNADGTATCTLRPINPENPSNPQYLAVDSIRTNFSAVADVDPNSPGPEIVTTYGQKLIVSDKNGKELRSYPLNTNNNESGPPTIADFDGDGALEVAFAGKTTYTLAEVLPPMSFDWVVNIHETSSGITGSSVFDFDGDGKAEVVYADEEKFYVFNGKGNGDQTTTERLKSTAANAKHSLTAIEYPLVVDADADGHADIVVVSNANTIKPSQYLRGIDWWKHRLDNESGVKVYAEAENKWVPTRQVWNQHTYHYTNVGNDLSIPMNEDLHWKASWSNNFRQNVQKGNPRLAPDLTVKLQDLYGGSCQTSNVRTIKYALINQGDRVVPAGQAKVTVLVAEQGKTNFEEIHSEVNSNELRPGESIDLSYAWNVPAKYAGKGLKIRVEANRDGSLLECNSTNNYKEVDNVGTSAPNLKINIPTASPLTCDFSTGKVEITSFELVNTGALPIPIGQAKAVVRVESNGKLVEEHEVTNKKELAANGGSESFSYTYTVDGENSAKRLDIKIVADPGRELLECVESDNDVTLTPAEGLVCYKQVLG